MKYCRRLVNCDFDSSLDNVKNLPKLFIGVSSIFHEFLQQLKKSDSKTMIKLKTGQQSFEYSMLAMFEHLKSILYF